MGSNVDKVPREPKCTGDKLNPCIMFHRKEECSVWAWEWVALDQKKWVVFSSLKLLKKKNLRTRRKRKGTKDPT